jgi:hypothetical protein
MADAPGHDPGQAGFDWADYVAWIVLAHGSLAAAAEKLASHRAYEDDVASVERALRRLRGRGSLGGGTWGARALAAFGLPGAARERARWMGAYHSRFTDLPVPLAIDLVRLWDRPPISEDPGARAWLALAHATCALRAAQKDEAAAHLRRARASFAIAPPDARAEILLVEAFLASRTDIARVPSILDEVEPILADAMAPGDRACLQARLVDQRAYEMNKRGEIAPAEALYRAIAIDGAPPFVLCRRANGLAYARWKLGDVGSAATLAREAARHAGDGGHLRLRAMALTMLANILGARSAEGEDARARGLAIVASLDDEGLRLRFTRPRPPE